MLQRRDVVTSYNLANQKTKQIKYSHEILREYDGIIMIILARTKLLDRLG